MGFVGFATYVHKNMRQSEFVCVFLNKCTFQSWNLCSILLIIDVFDGGVSSQYLISRLLIKPKTQKMSLK